jgi:NAD(P)-dependent dehydrogenase (short-subunit alcohol dehydrogenase family)
MGADVLAASGDITDVAYCQHVADTTVETLGRVDCLVNVATRAPFMPDRFSNFVDADLHAWRRTFEVDVFGTLAMTQAVARHMRTARRGSVIFVNTVGVSERYEP